MKKKSSFFFGRPKNSVEAEFTSVKSQEQTYRLQKLKNKKQWNIKKQSKMKNKSSFFFGRPKNSVKAEFTCVKSQKQTYLLPKFKKKKESWNVKNSRK